MEKNRFAYARRFFSLSKTTQIPSFVSAGTKEIRKHALLGIHSGSVFLWKTLAKLENYVDKRGYKWYHNGIVPVI